MKDLNYSPKGKLFLLFLFLALIQSAFGALAFEFPYAFKLPNNQIFVIHKKGITITDKDFKTVVRREITFTGSERITTDEDYTKITHTMEHGEHLICIIKDLIFVFDINGNFLKQTNTLITNDPVEYYDLTITKEGHPLFNDAYTLFTIGYISGDEFHFLKYYFYDRTKKIELKAHLKAEDEIYSIKNSGISCKYMYFNLGINSELVCTYYANGAGIGLQKYERIDQSNTELECVKNLYIPTQDEVIYIKTTQIDDYNILIGWVTDKGIPYYAQYNIHFNEDEMSTIETNSFDDIKCQLKPQFFKFNFYTVKDYNGEALYTCLLERNIFPDHPNADILLGYFNSFSQNGDYTRFSTSENYFYENCTIHGYSIVYFETKYDFYVISDAVCDGIQMPIYRMFGELSEEEKLPPVTEAPIEEDLLYDSCNKCPDELCELDLKCSRPGDCKNQEYYGEKCDQSCALIDPLCVKCSRDGKCLGCKDNKYWGDTCDHVCENCPEETCTVDGKCINQEDDCIDNNY